MDLGGVYGNMDASDVNGLKEDTYFNCQTWSSNVSRSFSLESCFELGIATMTGNSDAPAQLPVAEVSRQTPADKLFSDGRIVPKEKLNKVETNTSLPEKTRGTRDAGGKISNEGMKTEVRILGTLFTGEETSHRGVLDKQKKQKNVETRKIFLLSAAIQNGFIKNFIKLPAERIRLAFKSESKPRGGGGGGGDSNMSGTFLATRPPVFRKPWTPIYNWFTLKYNKGSKQATPKIVEINGQGTMLGSLKDVTVGRVIADGRPSRGSGEFRDGITKSAPSSPRHKGGFYASSPEGERRRGVERDNSITAAILHCKRYYEK